MSTDPVAIEIVIPIDTPIDYIRSNFITLFDKLKLRINKECSSQDHFYIKDQLYLQLVESNKTLIPTSFEIYLRPVLINDSLTKMDPLIAELFFDKSINKYNLVEIQVWPDSFMYSKPIVPSGEDYAGRIINLAIEIHSNLNAIRTVAYHPFYLYGTDGWCGNNIFNKLCNMDVVFHSAIWFAIVDTEHYGGEDNLFNVLKEVYEVWTIIYRNQLEKDEDKNSQDWKKEYDKGMPMPKIERLPNGHLFFKKSAYYELECAIDKPYNKEMKQLYEKLLREKMNE